MIKSVLLATLIVLCLALDVPKCGDPKVPILKFSFYNGTADPQDSTRAELCHDGENLMITWQCIDQEIISPYQHCNDPLYNADAVEVFIATLDSYPSKYFQLEVSPKSQLFFADITNPTGYCSNLGTEYKDCGLVEYQSKTTANGWQAFLKMKLPVIGRGKVQKQFRVNLFRIDKSSNKPTKYLSWQPTLTPTPCFHVPKVFDMINLI